MQDAAPRDSEESVQPAEQAAGQAVLSSAAAERERDAGASREGRRRRNHPDVLRKELRSRASPEKRAHHSGGKVSLMFDV